MSEAERLLQVLKTTGARLTYGYRWLRLFDGKATVWEHKPSDIAKVGNTAVVYEGDSIIEACKALVEVGG